MAGCSGRAPGVLDVPGDGGADGRVPARRHPLVLHARCAAHPGTRLLGPGQVSRPERAQSGEHRLVKNPAPPARCFVLLLLPQLCSARGRQALLSYALILTLAGPATNALRNARVLADSLRCGQVLQLHHCVDVPCTPPTRVLTKTNHIS